MDEIIRIIETERPNLVHLNNPDKSVMRRVRLDRHNCSLYDGVFSDDDVDEIIYTCMDKKIPMILETGYQPEDYWKIRDRFSV